MSASGSGRDARNRQLVGEYYRAFLGEALNSESEPLPDPREAAWEVARQWLSSSSADELFHQLDEHGLTICWQVPDAR